MESNQIATDLVGTKWKLRASFGGEKPFIIQNETVIIRAVWIEGDKVQMLVSTSNKERPLLKVSFMDLFPE